jgi:hypothetical protein
MPKAIVHGNPPSKKEEQPFAEQLLELDFPPAEPLHVWYTRLLETRDTDAIILAIGLGLFVIEMKSWSLTSIRGIDADGVELDPSVPRSTTAPPWVQAFNAADSMQNRIKHTTEYHPRLGPLWISPAAALFRVSRAGFRERFSADVRSKHALESITKGVLFSEDFADGKSFLARLRLIKGIRCTVRSLVKVIPLPFIPAKLLKIWKTSSAGSSVPAKRRRPRTGDA